MREIRQQFERFLLRKPRLGKRVFIARGAVVIGDVTLGDDSSVWFNAVLRGDINRIEVGHHSNIQDNAVLHLAEEYPCLIGSYVTIGHGAIVHGCTVGDGTLVGMGATILEGAVIGTQCLIGANALVTGGLRVPDRTLVLGTPARVVRALKPQELQMLRASAEKYCENAHFCRTHRLGRR